jgi:two-component system alkaline phosphatase synthesis response regulator PhoP
MRAVVVMSRPQVGAAEVDSPAAALRELGCEVVPVGYDMDDLPDDLEHIRPAVVVVDAGPYLEVGRAVVKHAKQIPTLAEVPILLCIEVSRLPGLDPELGMDDFVLTPIVGPELYARVRQLDWRLSSFSASGRVKLGDLVIDTVAVEASFRSRVLKLPRQEFLSRVWGYRYTGNTRTVDIHIRRLRAKLGPGAEMIETVRHVGYKMRVPGTS